MANNVIEILATSKDDAGPDLDALKLKMDELAHKIVEARADVNTAEGRAKLDAFQARLATVADRVYSPKVTDSGILRAQAATAALGLELDKVGDKKIDPGGGKGGMFSNLRKLLTTSISGAITSGGEDGTSKLPEIFGMALDSPAMLGGLAAASPFIGQAVGGGIVLGLGAALAGLGVAGAMQLKPVQKSFDDLKTHAVADLKDIGKPFAPVMEGIFKTATKVMGDLTPVFTTAEKIMAGPFKQFGETLEKSFDQPAVKTSIEAIAKSFGAILKALTPQLPGDIKAVANGITSIAQAVAKNPGAIASFISAIIKLAAAVLSIIGYLTRAADAFEKFMHSNSQVASGIRAAWNLIVSAVKGAVDLIIGVLKILIDLLHGDWKGAWNAAKTTVQQVWNAIKGIVQDGMNILKSVITAGTNAIKAAIEAGWNAVKSLTESVWNSIKAEISSVWNSIKSAVSSAINSVKSVISSGWNEAKSLTSSAWNAIRGAVSSGISAVLSLVSSLPGRIRSALGNLGGLLVSAGVALVEGLAHGIESAIGDAVSAAEHMASAVANAAKSVLSILSPSKVMEDIGKNVGQGLVNGIEGSHSKVSASAAKLATAVKTGVSGGVGGAGVSAVAGAPTKIQLEISAGGNSDFENFMVTSLRKWVRVKGGGNVQTAFGRS